MYIFILRTGIIVVYINIGATIVAALTADVKIEAAPAKGKSLEYDAPTSTDFIDILGGCLANDDDSLSKLGMYSMQKTVSKSNVCPSVAPRTLIAAGDH